MGRQQNHYRTVLDTANRSAEDNKPFTLIPAWAISAKSAGEENEGLKDIFSSELGQYIGSNADMMNYFQFCRIIETLLASDLDSLRSAVRFRRQLSLLFPAGEIASVEKGYWGQPPSVRTTFLGLYGVDSVLPDYFLNDIATHQEGSESLAAFLDIFHHRISELFYEAWKKYRYPFQFAYGGEDKLSICLLHLIGQGIQQQGREHRLINPLLDSRILGLLSVFHQRTRTACGIASIVKYLSPGSVVKVSEFQTQWVCVNNISELGKGSLRLNSGSAILGCRIKDNSHLIHIDITPDTFASARELLPKQKIHQKLLDLLRIYLGYHVDASVYLNIKKQWIPQAQLACGQMLGFNTGLGKGRQDKRIKVANYTYIGSSPSV